MEFGVKINDYVPVAGIIVHEKNDEGDPEYYLEKCEIKEDQNKFTLGVGEPLSVDFMRKMFSVIAMGDNGEKFSFKISSMKQNILLAEITPVNTKVMWFRKPSKATMIFSPSLEIPSGVCELPGLVFYVNQESISIWAIKSKTVNEKTVLYHAPFHNTNDGVCMGSVRKPKFNGNIGEFIDEWEYSFFNSTFTHLHGDPIKGNLNLVYKSIMNTDKPFPMDVLKKSNKKISKICTI